MPNKSNNNKRWTIKPEALTSEINSLSEQLSRLDYTLTNVLIQRGITSFEEAKAFFRPDFTNTHDPFLMQDMEVAVNRLQQAINKKEKILIYGDYDVDGSTSVALVYSFLKNYYDNLDYYIPDRYEEGYGISYKGIDFAKENDFCLIIALDCGIKAIDKIDYANSKGIDFIICDHHRPGKTIPKATAVLDPKRDDCSYPYKELSGCGVGFKLMQAWSIFNNLSDDNLLDTLDLLATSIAADIVPITGENRIYAHYGLAKINTSPRLGIKAMIEVIDLKKSLSISDVVFTIAPRINAAGRLESAKKAVEALIADNSNLAKKSSELINKLNTERRDIDTDICKEAIQYIENNPELKNKKTTVLYNENWHKGVIGIVASRLIESYYKPTIILTKSKGKITGSARSVSGYDVYNAIDACSDLLEQFGGHKYAAGLTFDEKNLDAFIDAFENVVASTITDDLLTPEIKIDGKLNFNQITDKFYRVLQQFAPFGPGNMKPVFMSSQVYDTGYAKTVGSENEHLKLTVFQNEYPDYKLSCIGFGLGNKLKLIEKNKPFRIVYTIEENNWNGNKTIQLNLKDLKV